MLSPIFKDELMIKEIKGSLLDTECIVIAHGVNCQNVMGAGVAKALYTKWPKVKESYHKVCEGKKASELLGNVYLTDIGGQLVANCFTQKGYGTHERMLDYDALRSCMGGLKTFFYQWRTVKCLAMPRIGCGLAGGDWEKVREILEEVFPEEFTILVYSL